jgi:predicted transcriptional regulator
VLITTALFETSNYTGVENTNEIWSRVIKIMDYYELNLKRLSIKTAISYSAITKYSTGERREFSPDTISKILRAFPDVDARWFVTGKGEMLDSSKGYTKHLEYELKIANEQLALYRRLSDKEQELERIRKNNEN